MNYSFVPQKVCSRRIDLQLSAEGVIESVVFTGGCNGNLSGISKLVIGQKAEEVIERLQGTVCGGKGTSCPDQLTKALKEALAAQKAS